MAQPDEFNLNPLRARKRRADQMLDPVVSQMRDLEKRKQLAIRVRARALDLDDELSSANNSYNEQWSTNNVKENLTLEVHYRKPVDIYLNI